MNGRSLAIGAAGLVGLSLALLVGSGGFSRAPESMRERIARTVPAAAPLVRAHGAGFVASPQGVTTSGVAAGEGAGGHAIATTAPAVASRPFRVEARGAKRSVEVSLVGAAAKPVAIEDGLAVYRGAYDGVDALAVPGQETLEVLYFAREIPSAPLALAVDLGPRDSLREEPTTHAAIVVDEKGRAKVRVGAPRAIDARGVTRAGRYTIAGRELRIALDWRDLTPPVVIDPTITLPFWSILDDPRVPGQTIYDATLQSRQSHAVFDTTRERIVLLRPVRTRLDTDTNFMFGDATNMIDMATRAILPTPRTSAPDEPVAGDAAVADWSRGYDLESETWEWNGTAWSINDGARLPGLVDPSLAFDGARNRVVLYGGAPQKFNCAQNATGYVYQDMELYCSAPLLDATATWEYDGTTWTPKRIDGSPSPRIRASLAWMPSIGKTVLFGGRAFSPNGTQGVSLAVEAYPESLTGELLADTWTYDGSSWARVPAGAPPDAREGAQVVYDAARGVLVLVGGHSASDVAPDIDRLAIWEFDGTDWSQKLVAGDPTLPRSIATRHAASAFYNATRQRTTILGGSSDMLDFCTLTSAQIASQLSAAQGNVAAMTALQQTGCLGGFVHDAWEWDGHSLVKVADVAFGGVQSSVQGGIPVFEQASGQPAWQASGAASGADGGAPLGSLVTSSLPYRYDERPDHFPLRTPLERAHLSDAGPPDPPASVAVGALQLSPGPGVSPLFAATVHPDVFFDPTRGVATLLVPGTAAVYETNGATWTDRTPARTPFSGGVNDFLAMTWDTTNARLVAFDPRDASTWSYTDAQGWQPLSASGSPSPWGLDPSIRSKQDIVRTPMDVNYGSEAAAFATVEQNMPKMTFDRGRGRVVMLYASALWEFDGVTWTKSALPPTWKTCPAATFLRFDGGRAVSVAFGCNVPADTWQWNGAVWAGPGPTPFTASIERKEGILVPPLQGFGGFVYPDWYGSLQLAWSHPDAVFESSALGGVSTFDGDGTVKTWNGTAWTAGPAVSSGMFCLQSLWDPSIPPSGGPPGTTIDDLEPYPIEFNESFWLGRMNLPMCFSPPVIEDDAHDRLVAFRDGPRGMLELPLAPLPAQRAWRQVLLGTEGIAPGSNAVYGNVQANPYPFELMAPELVEVQTQSDPATRTGTWGTTYTAQTAPERTVQNVWWPYRVVVDPTTSRVRLVTNRGMVWELTGEDVHGLGDPCVSDLDCATGACGTEGVCCDVKTCTQSSCMTCKGATTLGTCSPVAAGQPDPQGRCGSGPCAGSCPGTANAACVFNAALPCAPGPSCSAGVVSPGGHCAPSSATCLTPNLVLPTCVADDGGFNETQACVLASFACPGGLGCAADGVSCKSACATRADCVSPYAECQSGALNCGPDQASQLATQQGITPVSWTPPAQRTTAQIVEALEDAGVPEDDAGNFLLPSELVGGIQLAYDPTQQLSVTGLAMWTDYIVACMQTQAKVDECVLSSARCRTTTPWLGDPAGNDCVPESCLVVYLHTRAATGDPVAALGSVYQSGCYQGGVDGGAPDAAGPDDGGVEQ